MTTETIGMIEEGERLDATPQEDSKSNPGLQHYANMHIEVG